MKKVCKCQSIIKTFLFNRKKLPNSILTLKRLVKQYTTKNNKSNNNILSKITNDGRINSCIDEIIIMKILLDEIPNRVYKPKQRMWYDLLVYDYRYGWLPVNIKSSLMKNSDNAGNLTMCVYSYKNYKINLYKNYKNGEMSSVLLDNIKKDKYNKIQKRDYYFLVINKKNPNEVIVNSIKGLTVLTPNINNLPFQICWSKKINDNIKMFIDSLKRSKPSWKEVFLRDIRNISI